MVPKTKKRSFHQAFTLVEIMIAIVVLMISIVGMSAFRYTAALGARKADLRMTAVRTGVLLCETWRSLSGAETFDPVAQFGGELTIQTSAQGSDAPSGFTVLGNYKIVDDGASYYATLSWSDVSSGLRALNIIVAWEQRGAGSADFADTNKFFKLTAYVNN